MNLKSILKQLKLHESTISMLLGTLVIIVVGLLVVNYFRSVDPTNSIPDGAAATESNELPTTHTVAAGESLWTISELYYDTGYNWIDIQEANDLSDPAAIEEGMELTIPALATPTIEPTQTPEATITTTATPESTPETVMEPADDPSTPQPATDTVYTVERGDTLWDIAVQMYGDGYQWTKIAEANNLANPNIIHAGNVFQIPR